MRMEQSAFFSNWLFVLLILKRARQSTYYSAFLIQFNVKREQNKIRISIIAPSIAVKYIDYPLLFFISSDILFCLISKFL